MRDAIVSAELMPGTKLRIDSLGKHFEASIGAVREALSRLTAEGLVVAEPQKGFVVAPISRQDLEDLTEVRIDIECKCLAESIKHGDLDWEGRVLSLQHRLRSLEGAVNIINSPEAQKWHVLHEGFHDELAGACPNVWRLRIRRQLYVQSERYRRVSGPLDHGDRNVADEHDAIANAALARDTVAAKRAMAAHLRRTTAIIMSSKLIETR